MSIQSISTNISNIKLKNKKSIVYRTITMDELAELFSKASITQEYEKIKLVNCEDLAVYYKTVPLELREFTTQIGDFSNIDKILTQKCKLITNNVDLSCIKVLKNESISTLSEQVSGATDCVSLPLNNLSMYPGVREYLFKTSRALENEASSSTVSSNTGESISTLSEQVSVATDCALFAIDPETTARLFKVVKALEEQFSSIIPANTGEAISTLSEHLSVTPEYLASQLNELTMNPEVSESLTTIAEILDQVPPIV